MAIGFQMVLSVTRHFDMAIRWSINVETSMSTMQRLIEYIDLPQERQEGLRGQELKIVGNVEFDRVEMRYNPELLPALKNLTFKISAGQKVAVVGRTGAGKSSLYQLLLGFRRTSKGQVLIDDMNINEYSLFNLRSEINVVLQHPFVVQTDTIRQNLDPQGEFDVSKIKNALKSAALINETSADSHSYSLDLNQQANDLSLGQ